LKSRSLDQSGAFREQIKAAELEAERIEQEALSRTVADSVRPTSQLAPGDAAQANLQAYAAVIGRSLPKQAVNALLEALGSFTERVSERCDQGQGLRRDHV
jgi:hypothetical protein